MTEEIKKRTERFGDVSQVAKAHAQTVRAGRRFDRSSNGTLSLLHSGTEKQTCRALQAHHKCLVHRLDVPGVLVLSRIALLLFVSFVYFFVVEKKRKKSSKKATAKSRHRPVLSINVAMDASITKSVGIS